MDKALNFNDGKHVKAIPTLSKYACNAVPFKYAEMEMCVAVSLQSVSKLMSAARVRQGMEIYYTYLLRAERAAL